MINKLWVLKAVKTWPLKMTRFVTKPLGGDEILNITYLTKKCIICGEQGKLWHKQIESKKFKVKDCKGKMPEMMRTIKLLIHIQCCLLGDLEDYEDGWSRNE